MKQKADKLEFNLDAKTIAFDNEIFFEKFDLEKIGKFLVFILFKTCESKFKFKEFELFFGKSIE